jgi:prophage tail gpP-like protein
LSTTYKIKTGDTFETIARQQYGDDQQSVKIASANAGVFEPLVAGAEIIIPDIQDAPTDLIQQQPSADLDEVSILIDGQRFRFWDSITITRSIDAMDTIEYTAPFEAERQAFRDTFKPFSYRDTWATIGGEVLFNGIMMGVTPSVGEGSKIVSVSCYSRPGVLNDCNAPVGAVDLEFNGVGLVEITATLCAPFGISAVFESDPGAIFDRVALSPTKRILSFLIELANQRNLIISSTKEGGLLFWQSVEVGSPVAILRQGESPLTSIKPSFSPQEYYSHVIGIQPISIGLGGGQYSLKNDKLSGTLRPVAFAANDAKGAELLDAVNAKMGRMFANAISYSLAVSTWRDSQGNLWEPNTTIKVQAPDAMIYEEYEFLIRKVSLSAADNSRTAILDVVFTGAFRGEAPEVLPWD